MSQLPDTAVCLHCGYALRGLPDNVCPECGGAFDPVDPFTYLAPEHGWTAGAQRLAQGPGGLELLAILSGTLVILWPIFWSPYSWAAVGVAYLPEHLGNPIEFFVFLLSPPFSWIWLPLTCSVAWCSRLRKIRSFRRLGYNIASPQLTSPRWLALPICVALILSVLIYPWPLLLRFNVSRPFINQVVQQAKSTGKPVTNREAGLFWIRRAVILGDGRVKIEIRDHLPRPPRSFSFASNGLGFIWDPSCPEPLPGNYGLRLSRDWYVRDWSH